MDNAPICACCLLARGVVAWPEFIAELRDKGVERFRGIGHLQLCERRVLAQCVTQCLRHKQCWLEADSSDHPLQLACLLDNDNETVAMQACASSHEWNYSDRLGLFSLSDGPTDSPVVRARQDCSNTQYCGVVYCNRTLMCSSTPLTDRWTDRFAGGEST